MALDPDTAERLDLQPSPRTRPEMPRWLLAFGSGLIVVGTLIALFVGQEALSVYRHFSDNAFIADLSARFARAELLAFGGNPLVISEAGATLIAIALFIMIALLGLHIAIALIRAGAHILSPTFPLQLAHLKQRIDLLRARTLGRGNF